MRRLRVDRMHCAHSACPGIYAIIPLHGERAGTACSMNNPSCLREPGGHLMSRFMSTQPRSGLKSTAPTSAGRSAVNPFGVKELAESVCAAPLATEVPRGKPRTREVCQGDLPSVEGLTAALRRARDQSETASRAGRRLLGGANRELREPLTAMLRLNSDWDVRGTDMVAVRMIEQQRQALNVMADLIDGFLTIAEPGVPVAIGPVSRARRVLLIDEDRGVLVGVRIYLLCAGYRVCAAANADEAFERARVARVATSLIDIIIANSDLPGDHDGLAVIEKTRLVLGYSVPAILLTTQTSIEIGKPVPLADVSLLRKPVNLDEIKALIGEVLKRSRRSGLARPRTTGANPDRDETDPEVVC
jgi:ActR/RegA family two-component response regulator